MSPVTSHLCFDRKYQSSCLRRIVSALHVFEPQVFRDFQCGIISSIFLFFPTGRVFRVKRAKIKNEEYNSVKKEGDFYQNNMIFSNGKICLSKKLSNFLSPALTCFFYIIRQVIKKTGEIHSKESKYPRLFSGYH